MRQQLIAAAIHFAFAIGIRQNAWKLSNKCDTKEADIKADFTQYVEPAVEMFELAQELAMSTPNGAPDNYYDGIGNWYATYLREEGKLPEREVMLASMAEGLGVLFHDSLSHTQRDALAKKLKDFS